MEIARWLVREYPQDIGLVVTTAKNEIFEAVETQGLSAIEFTSGKQVYDVLKERGIQADLGLLAWWPHILKAPLLGATVHGFINTHPSLLPHNRGKHPKLGARGTSAVRRELDRRERGHRLRRRRCANVHPV